MDKKGACCVTDTYPLQITALSKLAPFIMQNNIKMNESNMD